MTFELYRDESGEYRWRLKAANGQVIANSGEGYVHRGDCVNGIALVLSAGRLEAHDMIADLTGQ